MELASSSSRRGALARAVAGFAGIALSLGACHTAGTDEPAPPEQVAPSAGDVAEAPPGAAFDASSVLVRFRPSVTAASVRAAVVGKVGSFDDRDSDGRYDAFATIDPTGNLVKIDLRKSMSVADALAELRADPSVLYAEPNYLLHAAAVPNDTRFAELWGLHNTGQTGGTADADVDAPEAWDITTGSRNVVIGVVDTGIDYTHPDLAANLWVNPGEVAGNGLDDDGNGVIDDVHGYNAIDGSGNATDDNDHGSHCAGTAGAVGGNGVGITGVAQRVSLMSLKFLSASGSGSTAGAIAALDYAVARRNAGVNLRVLNNSWGGGGFSQALLDAITATNAAGILFVAVSGGSGANIDLNPVYPAAYDVPNILVVTATDHSDVRASFAGWGPNSVDMGAPGRAVLSTVRGGYAVFSGTSMAAPHVAGTAALMLTVAPTLSVPTLKSALMSTGDTLPSLVGATVSGKRLNAAAAVAAVAGPPPAPPTAAFSFAATNLAVAFTDTSTDMDGTIAARSWSFGDGATSTAANPSHTYAAAGTYTVTLTVTDDDGLTATVTRQVAVTAPARPRLNIERVTRNRARLEFIVDLRWSGATGVQVELWRNGLIVDLPDNDGAHLDAFRRYETAFTWRLCELRSSVCSNEVSLDVGSADAATATVTRREGDVVVTRVVPIVDE